MISSTDVWAKKGGRKANLKQVRFSDVPGWKDDDHAAAFVAFRKSCGVILTRKRGRSQRLLKKVCAKAVTLGSRVSRDQARTFFERNFRPYTVASGSRKGLLTGYYEPVLKGSRIKTGPFQVPVFKRPPDLVNVVDDTLRGHHDGEKLVAARKGKSGLEPYPTRAEIEQGALDGQGLELVYLADPIDAFFMHVQGSAKIKLTDGKTISIGYAGKNGYKYTSIGGVLIDKGEISWDHMTLGSLRQWLSRDKEMAKRLMWQNKSFIFFREHPMEDVASGPKGAMEIGLTKGRSLAVDAGYHAIGTPVFVSAPSLKHGGAGRAGRGFARLMVAQDVGSAIRGPERGDIYFGSGDRAGQLAGQTKHRGKFYVLLPRKNLS